MATTMTLIAKQTVGADGAESITFSSIPQTYKDLKLVMSTRASRSQASAAFTIVFNGITANHSSVFMRSDGTSIISYNGGSSYYNAGESVGNSATSSTFSNGELYIPNYTSSDYKSFNSENVSENNATEAYSTLGSGLWSNTSEITSIEIGLRDYSGSVVFLQNSTFYLYGISNGSNTQSSNQPFATGGDLISTDGTYWYHTFLSSGTFIPLRNLITDYLVVAGGGGGGRYKGGGGGAGGVRCSVTATGGSGAVLSALPLTINNSYAVVIGAGGAYGVDGGGGTQDGSNGSNSKFGSIIAVGGGGGGGAYGGDSGAGKAGGSGGGGNADANTTYGLGISDNGYNGGAPRVDAVSNGGGGGGAIEAGNTDGAGEGGDGITTTISGTSASYGGGGGGGSNVSAKAGGVGGGGTGGYTTTPTAGTTNTGGGGGGGAGDNYGGSNRGANGGSGVVIVRYAI